MVSCLILDSIIHWLGDKQIGHFDVNFNALLVVWCMYGCDLVREGQSLKKIIIQSKSYNIAYIFIVQIKLNTKICRYH